MSTKACPFVRSPFVPCLASNPQRPAERSSACLMVRGKNLMQLPEFGRSTTLRWTLVVAWIFAAFVVSLLGFVYLKARDDLTMRSDRKIASEMRFIVDLSSERRLDAIEDDLKQDPDRVRLEALFGPDGRRLAGNLERLPPDLKTDDTMQTTVIHRVDESGR